MTRVDFYILPEDQLSSRHEFACKLIQKTARIGHEIYVHCPDEESATAFDNLLWSFQPDSFIPHKLQSDNSASAPIVIGHNIYDCEHHDLLINLGYEVPAFFSQFKRVSEIVCQEKRALDATRKNYKHYQDRNYPLHRHDMRKR